MFTVLDDYELVDVYASKWFLRLLFIIITLIDLFTSDALIWIKIINVLWMGFLRNVILSKPVG